MSKNSSHDYSTLKNAVLDLWYRAVGVQTAADFVAENYEILFEDIFKMLNIPLDCEMKDFFKPAMGGLAKFWEVYILKTNFESYFDDQAPFQLDKAILTGSMSEGLFLFSTEAPDMDFMCVLKNITFSQKDQEDGTLVLRDDTPFVYAFVTNKETQDLWSDYFEGSWHRLSSRKLKEKLKENYQKTGGLFRTFGREDLEEVTDGAAVTIGKSQPVFPSPQRVTEFKKEFLRRPINEPFKTQDEPLPAELINAVVDKLLTCSDIVLSIFCEGWPTCAREWITRERLWPDMLHVEKIAHSGFHIVPKSSPDGDFRLSFSCAETMLIKTLSPLQHRVVRAFKAVIKYHQGIWSPTFSEILTSYHLKTIVFWHFEKTSGESYTEDTIVHHLVTLLEELAEALRIQTLPMYFMPEYNLFREVDDPEMMLELMGNVSQLSRNFSAMSKSLRNTCREARIVLGPEYHDANREDIFDFMRAEKLKKEQEGGESLFTFYDLFVLMKSVLKPSNA